MSEYKVSSRVMPEGMEWPRFEDGEPVRIGDEVQTAAGGEKLRQLSMCREGFYLRTDTCDEWHRYGERVKRPTPKLLDADGVEIELGDDLYSVEGGLKLHVGHIDRFAGKIATADLFAIDRWADPSLYTHRAPVLAADGKPLREGETVWTKDGFGWTVADTDVTFMPGCVQVRGSGKMSYANPLQLTHERPDSWSLLEEDAAKTTAEYWGCPVAGCDHCSAKVDGEKPWERLGTHGNCNDAKELDLVRRARALAERG